MTVEDVNAQIRADLEALREAELADWYAVNVEVEDDGLWLEPDQGCGLVVCDPPCDDCVRGGRNEYGERHRK